MSGFFEPPSRPVPLQYGGGEAPPWTGRPQGQPLGETVSDLLLARSERAVIRVAYIDAYPEGFELAIDGSASVPYRALGRGAHGSDVDVFGRHWPMVGEPCDEIPPQLLRIGVQYADGRLGTNISGHDHPIDGPVLWALSGGASGSGGTTGERPESRLDQGYWISPLPPAGPVDLVCEWPALGIPLVRHRLEGQAIRDAAERARAMFPDDRHGLRDGHRWRLGSDADVAWINHGTTPGSAVTAAIPPVFESYCTLALAEARPCLGLSERERALVALLAEQSGQQPWWLGYLDTGASDVVFPYAPRTQLYQDYGYVVVQAGPEAVAWREARFNAWALPDLIFPADRAWLVSAMWDDEWVSLGGSEQLISRLLDDPMLAPAVRRVALDQDVAPPEDGSD